MKNSFQEKHIRDEIVRAIDILVEQPNQRQEANHIMRQLSGHFQEKGHIFSLNSIVYGYFIRIVKAPEFQTDYTALSTFKSQLLGQAPYWATYALKYNFVELLQGEFLQSYRKLQQLLTILADRLNEKDLGQQGLESYENVREMLYESCYEHLKPYTIAELLVAHGCHILLSLPDDGNEYFDTLNTFGGIYPVSNIEAVDKHLNQVKDLLRKLQGDAVVFVDVHILSEGFVINWR